MDDKEKKFAAAILEISVEITKTAGLYYEEKIEYSKFLELFIKQFFLLLDCFKAYIWKG